MNLFSGIRILDLTRVFSGPLSTRYFADYGAEVIKVENPIEWDESRNFPPIKNAASGYFETMNRNKKSITLDLKNPIDRDKLYEMVKTVDVMVENFSPEVVKRLGLDYETIRKHNEKIIYVSVSGYGRKVDKKAYDIVIQWESGLASLGTGVEPMKNSAGVADAFTGMSAAWAISSALFNRERTGNGEYIDVSMLGSALHLLLANLTKTSITGEDPELTFNRDGSMFPFGFFKVRDGYISLAAGNDQLWKRFADAFLPDISESYNTNAIRVESKPFLTEKIELAFASYGKDELVEKLTNMRIPCGKIRKMSDLLADDSLFEEGYLKRISHPELGECVVAWEGVKFQNHPIESGKLAPHLWEHNAEYL